MYLPIAGYTALWLALWAPSSAAKPTPSNVGSQPVVDLKYGAFAGVTQGNVERFYGMPFAAPPVGNLRFAPPQGPISFTGVRNATAFGPSCPQQVSSANPTLPSVPIGGGGGPVNPESEDCLFVNVIKPANIKKGKKLPVVVWIYGGGFQLGDTSTYNGVPLVERSIALDQPVVYVSANYRVSAYGFLGGREAKAAKLGNVGILDQVSALEWVKKNIREFGGDPNKVTIWGESAGAVSVGIHLVRNNGITKNLFHGGFMQSGGPIFFDKIENHQYAFDDLVAQTGCAGSSDKIACLRAVPYAQLQAAVVTAPGLMSYQSLRLAFGPSVDGNVIARNPQASVKKGLYARVPFVSGNCDDEGTLFSFGNMNVTTDAHFREYIHSNYFPTASTAQIDEIARVYPDDPTQGSPFNTGYNNSITPQFKRIAAFQGDWLFQATRRFFLQYASKTQPAWSFLYVRGKQTPILGAMHAADVPEFFGTNEQPGYIGTDALISFANTFNPNTRHPESLLSSYDWKQYKTSRDLPGPSVLTFVDPANEITTTYDVQREEAFRVLTEVTLDAYGANA